jgi:hypothetical protein
MCAEQLDKLEISITKDKKKKNNNRKIHPLPFYL